MSVRSGQSITVLFTTRNYSTGAASNADSTPTGTLYVNGTSNAASVTVTNVTTGIYKAAVTLPTLAVGDVVNLSIAATVNSVSDNGVIWSDTKDIVLDANGRVEVQSGITVNTALANFTFVLYSSADHTTPLTGAAVTATRSLDGAAFGACANSVSEVGSGVYKINLAAGDTNGATVTLKFTAAGADTRFFSLVTTP